MASPARLSDGHLHLQHHPCPAAGRASGRIRT